MSGKPANAALTSVRRRVLTLKGRNIASTFVLPTSGLDFVLILERPSKEGPVIEYEVHPTFTLATERAEQVLASVEAEARMRDMPTP